MDISNSVLIQWGKVSISQQDYVWEQPTLSSNGTMGGESFAVSGYNLYGTSKGAYQAFDNNSSTSWTGTGSTGTIIWYNPIPLRVTAVKVQNRANGDYMVRSGTIYGSNDNSNWTKIQDFSNSTSAIAFTIDISNANYYNYYKFEFFSNSSYNSILEIEITAVYKSDRANLITFPQSYSNSNYAFSLGSIGEFNTSYAISKTISSIEIFNPQATSNYLNYLSIGY